jgi:hypothetical protein
MPWAPGERSRFKLSLVKGWCGCMEQSTPLGGLSGDWFVLRAAAVTGGEIRIQGYAR